MVSPTTRRHVNKVPRLHHRLIQHAGAGGQSVPGLEDQQTNFILPSFSYNKWTAPVVATAIYCLSRTQNYTLLHSLAGRAPATTFTPLDNNQKRQTAGSRGDQDYH